MASPLGAATPSTSIEFVTVFALCFHFLIFSRSPEDVHWLNHRMLQEVYVQFLILTAVLLPFASLGPRLGRKPEPVLTMQHHMCQWFHMPIRRFWIIEPLSLHTSALHTRKGLFRDRILQDTDYIDLNTGIHVTKAPWSLGVFLFIMGRGQLFGPSGLMLQFLDWRSTAHPKLQISRLRPGPSEKEPEMAEGGARG